MNEAGRSQARALAKRKKNEAWDAIFARDLSRAMETADWIAAVLGLTVHTDARLREVHCGEREGTTYEDRFACWGEGCELLALGRETHTFAIARGREAIAEIVNQYSDKRILIVSHGELLEVTLVLLTLWGSLAAVSKWVMYGITSWQMQFYLFGIAMLVLLIMLPFSNHVQQLSRMNCNCHRYFCSFA